MKIKGPKTRDLILSPKLANIENDSERHKCGRTNRIPSIVGFESISAAARVRTMTNVIDALVPESSGVQQRIDETKHGLMVEKTVVINQ